MNNLFSVKDKVVLIPGPKSGLGPSFAKGFVMEKTGVMILLFHIMIRTLQHNNAEVYL